MRLSGAITLAPIRSHSEAIPVAVRSEMFLADRRRTGAASTKSEEKGSEEEGPWMRTVNSEMGQ